MPTKFLASGLVTLVVLTLGGCATTFSPEAVRAEIARQTGDDPQRAFELSLGRATLTLARHVMGPRASDDLPLSGLTRLELAVYRLPMSGSRFDVTRMAVSGWEAAVRSSTAASSTMVLVRDSRGALADLVLLTAGEEQAFYARLSGRLDRELAAALGDAVETRGVDAVKSQLMSLAGAP